MDSDCRWLVFIHGTDNYQIPFLSLPAVCLLQKHQPAFMHFLRFLPVARLIHNPIPENVTFGMTSAYDFCHLLHVYGFIIMVYSLNVLCFIPLGQLASHLMLRQEKLISYSWNLIGSLLGIILFTLLSALWSPPAIWILFVVL